MCQGGLNGTHLRVFGDFPGRHKTGHGEPSATEPQPRLNRRLDNWRALQRFLFCSVPSVTLLSRLFVPLCLCERPWKRLTAGSVLHTEPRRQSCGSMANVSERSVPVRKLPRRSVQHLQQFPTELEFLPRVVQPIVTPVRLQIGLVLKNAQLAGLKCCLRCPV